MNNGANVVAENSVFTNNVGNNVVHSGALYMDNSIFTAINCTFSNNNAAYNSADAIGGLSGYLLVALNSVSKVL